MRQAGGRGFIPLGAALILFNPETEEGAAAVTLFAVPQPAALVLVALGLLILPRRRSGREAISPPVLRETEGVLV